MTTLPEPVTARTPTPPLSMPTYIRSADRLSPTTRHLCGAAFLVPGFADRVVHELVGEMRRSVPPSHGFDLDPIIRQCFRVRRRNVLKQLAASGLYLLAAWFSPPVVVVVTLIGALVAVARSAALTALLKFLRIYRFRRWILWFLTIWTVYLAFMVITLVITLQKNLREALPAADTPAVTAPASGGHPVLLALITLAGLAGMLFAFRRDDYRTVTGEFAQDKAHHRRKMRDTLVEDRLAMIAAAQRGNVVVHHDNPFLGCGQPTQGWSLSMTLKPRTPAGEGSDQPVAIDVIALNRRLKERIESMRAPWLDVGQRVGGLSVSPYVVADGIRDENDPVIDRNSGMPYTKAGPDALDAILINPQGGLRQYLRVVVPVRGKAIRDAYGQEILGAQPLGISVSAFVHVAVEGGMLYTEFIGTVLPPLRPECRLADVLRPERAGSYALSETLRISTLVDIVAGIPRLFGAAGKAIRLRWEMFRSVRQAGEFRTHDYGARFSVRELAASEDVESYLQQLDGIKYVKLIDRIVGETIIDFLIESGVNPAEFRQAITQITNQTTTFNNFGDISGGQISVGGSGNAFNQSGGSPNG